MTHDQRYCPRCEASRLAARPQPNHILHLLITLFAVGLWLPVWIALTWRARMGAWRCQACGAETRPHPPAAAGDTIDMDAYRRHTARMVAAETERLDPARLRRPREKQYRDLAR